MKELSNKIDNAEYAANELVEIKLTLNLPYYNFHDNEDLRGEIVINGNHYNCVTRKVMNDTLCLFCLPNEQKDELMVAKKDYGKEANDFDGAKERKGSKKENSFAKYSLHNIEYHFSLPQKMLAKQYASPVLIIQNLFIANPYIPPKQLC